MVDRNDSFLREVNEEIRRERLMRIWERYGVFLVAGVLVLFVGVGVYQWNQSSRRASEEKAGASFEAAIRLASEGKTDDALKALGDIAQSGPRGYGALARLRIAAQQSASGRPAEAIAAYEALAADSGVDRLLRDFATLQSAMLRVDQADWTEMKNRLTPLLDDKQPWRAEAREVLGLAAMKAGQTEEATKLFEQLLGDRGATSGMSRRAQEMLAILTDQAAAKNAPTASAAGDTTDKAAPAAEAAKGNGGEPAARN
jgi:hypothetical protein